MSTSAADTERSDALHVETCFEKAGGRLGAVGLLLYAVIPLILFLFPTLTEYTQFDRAAIESGQYWRLISAQFTHWTGDHLFWNASTTLLLWQLCQRKALVALFLIWCSIPPYVYCCMPQFDFYRGLSGYSSALLAVVLCETYVAGRKPIKILSCLISFGFLAKLIYEQYTQSAFFAGSSELFIPTPLTHLLGFIGGILLFSCYAIRSATRQTKNV